MTELIFPDHIPVLFDAVEAIFAGQNNKKTIIDATLGLGGHTRMMLRHLTPDAHLYGLDRDGSNLARATDLIRSEGFGDIFIPIHSSFAELGSIISEQGIGSIDFILYDLGVSSVHYDEAERGFSFRFDGPLDMRFDTTRGKMAADLVATLDARELARIFDLYGEEKKSWFIANAIVKARSEKPILTTFDLLRLIEASSYDKKSPIRVFQALRIAVNEEFVHIEQSLQSALTHLAVGGKIAVITFHSLEDRLVKKLFAPYLEDTIDELTGQIREQAHYRKGTKKPIEPTPEEIASNPRARSAKMRIIERVY